MKRSKSFNQSRMLIISFLTLVMLLGAYLFGQVNSFAYGSITEPAEIKESLDLSKAVSWSAENSPYSVSEGKNFVVVSMTDAIKSNYQASSNVKLLKNEIGNSVFEIKFDMLMSGIAAEDTYSCGILFGMNASTATSSDDVSYFEFRRGGTAAYLKDTKVAPEAESVEGNQAWATDARQNVKIEGKKDGSVIVTRIQSGVTMVSTYKNMSVEGYFAFFVKYSATQTDTTYDVRYENVEVNGFKVSYPDDPSFVVPEGATSENYTLDETFESSDYNKGDWTLYNEDESITFEKSLFIDNSFNGKSRFVSNIAFIPSATDDIVFDISFEAFMLKQAPRNTNINYCFMFGMPSHDALITNSNVGVINFTIAGLSVYRGRDKIAPVYNGEGKSEATQVYIENDYRAQYRLVAHKNGVLDLYRAYPAYETLDEKLASYSGMNFTGYVGITSNTKSVIEGTGEDAVEKNNYEATFSRMNIKGNALTSKEKSILGVKFNLPSTIVVSDELIDLSASVVAKPNLNSFKGVTYSVVSGNAEIVDGTKLKITGAGDIKVKAVSTLDQTKFTEVTTKAIKVEISDIKINATSFENINVDSQPIELTAQVTVTPNEDKYKGVIWSVVSGNATIVGNTLRIDGAGEVKIKVTSLVDASKFDEFTFEVKGIEKKSGCKSDIKNGTLNIACIIAVLGLTMLVSLRRNKDN